MPRLALLALLALSPMTRAVPAAAQSPATDTVAVLYEMGAGRSTPVYRYSRRETAVMDKLVIDAVFSDPAGNPVATESTVLRNGSVEEYTLRYTDPEELGKIEIRDGKARFTYVAEGRTSESAEKVSPGFVAGPSLFFHLRAHWKEILEGGTVSVRLAVVDRRETVGFKLFKSEELEREGRRLVRVTLKPSSLIISSLVDPVTMLLDRATAKPVEILGRTLLKRRVAGKWQPFVAEMVFN